MAKRLLTLFFLMVFIPLLHAQQPNAWIDYSKTYYKISVSKNGVYRLPQSLLQSLGLGNVSGSAFKLYNKGQEVPIYVTNSGTFGSSDYIEFYAKKNDGQFDTHLFQDPNWQASPQKSLFTDIAMYYLTYDNTTTNLRYTDDTNELSNLPPKEEYFMYPSLQIHANAFYAGTPTRLAGVNYNYADFEKGECWASSLIAVSSPLSLTLETPAIYSGPNPPFAFFEAKAVGRSNAFSYIPDHHLTIKVGGTTYVNTEYEGYDLRTFAQAIPVTSLNQTGTVVEYRSIGDISDNDQSSAVYTQITYPRRFDFSNRKVFAFTLENNSEKYLEIGNFDGGNSPILYDITNKKRYTPVLENGVYKIHLPAGAGTLLSRELVMVNTTSTTCLNSSPACFFQLSDASAIPSIQFTNFSNVANQGNYIILTHPSLRAGATDYVQEYANYRESALGGGYNAVIVNIEELYDQYAWGIQKHPLAIRNFVNSAVNNWTIEPQLLFLLGKSISYDKTNSPAAFQTCLVPTWGNVASDIMLAVPSNDSYVPQLGVGRVSAQTPEHVAIYLNKIQAMEAPADCSLSGNLWRKNAMRIALGHNAPLNDELALYNSYLDTFEGIYENVQMGGQVVASFGSPSVGVSYPQFGTYLDAGLGLIDYMGHSDGPFWNINNTDDPYAFNNEGKYPMILSGSCFVGNVHGFNDNSMAATYVLANKRGSIGFLATVSFGFPIFLHVYMEELHKQFCNTNYNLPFGLCLKKTIENVYIDDVNDPDYEGLRATIEEYTYQGDPAFVLGGLEKPEYIIENTSTHKDVNLFNVSTNQMLVGAPINLNGIDNVQFQINVTNVGQALTGNFVITITCIRPDGTQIAVAQESVALPSYNGIYNMVVNVPSSTQAGLNTYVVTINSTQSISEYCTENNVVQIPVLVPTDNCAALPQPTITNADISFCLGDSPVVLTANPAGGVFTIDGATATTFNPSGAGVGTHLISYNYNDQATGCQLVATSEFTVTATPSPAFSTLTTSACLGEPINFVIDSYSPNVSYSWSMSGGTITGSTGSYMAQWTTAGTKTVVLNASQNGCSATSQTVNIVVEEPLATPVIACGATTQNSITFSWSAVPNAAGYEVYLNDALAATVGAAATSYEIAQLEPGTGISATIVAIGTGGCGNSASSALQLCTAQNCPTNPIQIEGVSSVLGLCKTDLPVTITANFNGTFNFNGQAYSGNQIVIDPATLNAGNYTLSFNTSIGASCQYSSPTYTIEVANNPQPGMSGNDGFCQGGSVLLSTVGNYTSYLWSNGATTSNISTTIGGEYCVTVTNTNGCEGIVCKTITANSSPTPTISAQGSSAICDGQSVALSVVGDYTTYAWSNFEPTPTSVVFSPGNYTVTVSDDNGCTGSASFAVTEASIQAPAITINGGTQTQFCSGTDVTLAVADGYAAYAWSTGDSDANTAATSSGTYRVTVTSAEGCKAQTDVFVNFVAAPSPQVSASATTACEGSSVNLTVSTTNTATYSWSNGATGQNTTIIAGNPITVTAIDNSGCEGSTEYTVETYPNLVGDLEASVNTSEVCPGDVITLSANGIADNATVAWTGANLQANTGAIVDANPTQAGIYGVIATDINGCAKTDSVRVDISEDCQLPNAITPNGDNFNDTWSIPAANQNANIQVDIYSRWGQLVYSANGYNNANGWGGTDSNGKDLPHGTYYYVITYNDGTTKPDSGHITIIR